ncbi:hypothetical protein [Nocardia harenae]|uniref:hypothetical protein n=1 Tax=Nocardia harenae TaxID=358707 RepID=UPI00082C845D|nr:hypothetical protein [Nocardia harenae]
MHPGLPPTFIMLRRALAGAIVFALIVLALLALLYGLSGLWQTPFQDTLAALEECQYVISHLVPFPWE